MRKSLITAVLIASLLAGSAVGQKKHQRPPVKTPDEFRGVEPTTPVDANSMRDGRVMSQSMPQAVSFICERPFGGRRGDGEMLFFDSTDPQFMEGKNSAYLLGKILGLLGLPI